MRIDIIFDSDGTLFPTLPRQEAWFKFWAGKNDVEWPFGDFAEFQEFYNRELDREGGVQNVYDFLKLPCNMKDTHHPVWAAYGEFNAANPSEPYYGMVETIKKLDQIRTRPGIEMKFGINSSNTWKNIRKDLEKCGLTEYFDSHVTKEDLDAFELDREGESLKKPSTFSLALSMFRLGVPIEGKVIHVGDTMADAQASYNIIRDPRRPENLITVGAMYGFEGEMIALKKVPSSDGKMVGFEYAIKEPLGLVEIVKEIMEK